MLLKSHRHAWVLLVHLAIATQQLLGLFGNYFRQNYLHFNKLISVRVWIAERWRAACAQTELLSRLGSGWNSQLRFARNSWDFNFGAERGFRHGNGHRHVNVVALAREI